VASAGMTRHRATAPGLNEKREVQPLWQILVLLALGALLLTLVSYRFGESSSVRVAFH
jgi:hypothetical protein